MGAYPDPMEAEVEVLAEGAYLGPLAAERGRSSIGARTKVDTGPGCQACLTS